MIKSVACSNSVKIDLAIQILRSIVMWLVFREIFVSVFFSFNPFAAGEMYGGTHDEWRSS